MFSSTECFFSSTIFLSTIINPIYHLTMNRKLCEKNSLLLLAASPICYFMTYSTLSLLINLRSPSFEVCFINNALYGEDGLLHCEYRLVLCFMNRDGDEFLEVLIEAKLLFIFICLVSKFECLSLIKFGEFI